MTTASLGTAMPDGSKAGVEELTGVGVFLRPGSHPQMASAVPAPLWMQSAGGHHTACLLFSLSHSLQPHHEAKRVVFFHACSLWDSGERLHQVGRPLRSWKPGCSSHFPELKAENQKTKASHGLRGRYK